MGTMAWQGGSLHHGAELHSRTDEGWQPIHVAAHTGQTQLARFLVAQGAELRARTKIGHEVVHLATDAGEVWCQHTTNRSPTHTKAGPSVCLLPPLFPAQIDFVQWLLRTTNGEVAGAKDDGTTSAPLGLRSLVFNAHR